MTVTQRAVSLKNCPYYLSELVNSHYFPFFESPWREQMVEIPIFPHISVCLTICWFVCNGLTKRETIETWNLGRMSISKTFLLNVTLRVPSLENLPYIFNAKFCMLVDLIVFCFSKPRDARRQWKFQYLLVYVCLSIFWFVVDPLTKQKQLDT